MIDLFETSFVESQEATGIKVIGQFRDLDNPDTFTWLRGFGDMAGRAQRLTYFYDGPVWERTRDAANATMLDSDNVLMLRPAQHDSAFTLDGERPPPGVDPGLDRGVVEATILFLGSPAEKTGILSFFQEHIAPAVGDAAGSILAYFVTEPGENNFPRLPIRAEQVFVWFSGFADLPAVDRSASDDGDLRRALLGAPNLVRPPQFLRLEPTSRSRLSGLSPACRMASARSPEPE